MTILNSAASKMHVMYKYIEAQFQADVEGDKES